MASEKITKRTVDAALAGEAPYFLWDTAVKGFGLKVTPSGKKVYILQYRNGGRETPTQRFTIGTHGSPWTPDEARKEAIRLMTQSRQGNDPRTLARKRKADAVTLAFEDYTDFFIEQYLKVQWKDSWKEAQRILKRDVVPVLRRRPLTEITKSDISNLLTAMNDRPASKRLTYAVLNKLFNWAHQERDDITISPMANLKPPPPVPSRDRVLTAEELVSFLIAVAELPYPFGPYYRFLVATLRRRENVAGISWQQIDLQENIWILYKDDTKNDDVHLAPLNQAALAVLAELGPKRAGLLFTTTGKTPISGFSKSKEALDMRMIEILRARAMARGEDLSDVPDDVLLPPWVIHDLRRTAISKLQAMGVPVEVTEEVLAHKTGTRSGVAGVYNKYRYLVEKQVAVQIWGEYLSAVQSGPLASEPKRKLRYAEQLMQKSAEAE